MKEVMVEVAQEFSRLLRTRLSSGAYTTEDSVRYTFFAALLRNNISAEQIVLEYPHPALRSAEIDAVILATTGSPQIAIEFKYDRTIPSKANQPRPQKAGAAFRDLVRLLKIPSPCLRYFVYATDGELAHYLSNPQNGLSSFFGLQKGAKLELDREFFSRQSPTFHKSMGDWPYPAALKGLASEELPQEHYLRIYEVEPLDSRLTRNG